MTMGRRATISTTSSDGDVMVRETSAPADGAPSGDAPAKPRRKRGPNKPKVSAITVRTEAEIGQAVIVDLLRAHVAKELGQETADAMELQMQELSTAAKWGTVMPDVVRFATKGAR
jgi:hypothetical protein